MLDTMTITKVGGGLAGALLVFLLLNWAADVTFSTETAHGEGAEAAYVIEVEGADTAVTETTESAASNFADLFAAADAKKGAKTFSKCKACHKVEKGKNAVGPSLYGVVGRDVASMAGYSYSGALTGIEGVWTAEKLNNFLTKPRAYAKGTKMTFKGLKKDTDRANLIAYLSTFGN